MTTFPLPYIVAQMLSEIRVAFNTHTWFQVASLASDLQHRVSAEFVPTEVYRMQGRALLAMKNYADAKEAWDVVCVREPYDVAALVASSHARIGLRDYEATLHLLTRALALTENDSQRLALLRICSTVLARLTHQGRRAVEAQWRALLLHSNERLSALGEQNTSWLAVKLAALEGLGRNDEAMSIAQVLTARPDATAGDWISRARLAWRIARESPNDEVRDALDAASRLAPHNAIVVRARGELRAATPPEHIPPRLARLGFPLSGRDGITSITPPLCNVPAGVFLMGNGRHGLQPYPVDGAAFAIARYPVTVAEYACFIREYPHRAPLKWRKQMEGLNHPVTFMTWGDALAYAAWLTERTGQPWRLPSEAEWEKAACWNPHTGATTLYPWGASFDESYCNTYSGGISGTLAVGMYPHGGSPCGAQDMSGNVYEWTHSRFAPYPYSIHDGREDESVAGKRTIRGGSWASHDEHATAVYRKKHDTHEIFSVPVIGFRLVLGDPPW